MDNKILEKLAQLIINTSPKETHQIIVSRNKTDFNTIFNPPLELDKNKEYEIALVDLETYYSFPNINEKNNQIQYGLTPETSINPDKEYIWKPIIIPIGSYDLNAINDEVQIQLERWGDANAFKLSANINTFKSILEIKPNYCVKFHSLNNMKDLLGFTEDQYNKGTHTSENMVSIIKINSILIHINIINGSIVNGSREPVIYSFFPKVSPGYKIVQTPVNPIYLPVSLNTIREFHVSITDQNNIPLDLRGEEVTIRFHIRQK